MTALVTIQKGCDNHCAYCVVPFTRGREVSRPAAEVVAEVARFVAAGAREVTLIGQNVNSYHGIGIRSDGGSAPGPRRRVLVVDMDPQANATSGLGLHRGTVEEGATRGAARYRLGL